MAFASGRGPARRRVQGAAFRQTADGQPPLWHDAGLGGAPLQPDGRWHRRGQDYAQYLALSAAGAWAENVRYFHLRTPEQVVEQRRSLWHVHVDVEDIADLSTFDDWVDCGLDPGHAVDDEHRRCQDLAQQLRADGYQGVLAPSASLPGAVNLTLFGRRYEHVTLSDPADLKPRDPDVWLRVALAVEDAHPPQHLVSRTRFRGQPHGNLVDWLGSRTATGP